MTVDHIGYAVKNIEKAEKQFVLLGYSFEPVVDDPDRNIRIAFGFNGSLRIELVAPADAEGGTPVDTILRDIGATPYHICYRSIDIEADIENLCHHRFKLTLPPLPAVAFGGRRVAFMYSLQVGLIEIVEE